MNEDYLWNKSGPPDPEIQQLEEILGTLRYQPKPLELPRNVARRRNYVPLLAIAATLLLALLGGGIWLRVRTRDEVPPQQVTLPSAPRISAPPVEGPKSEPQKRPESTLTVNYKQRSKPSTLGKREREEALAVKQQLMLALRLASEKLNLAHKKTQSTPPTTQIKNQHRVG